VGQSIDSIIDLFVARDPVLPTILSNPSHVILPY